MIEVDDPSLPAEPAEPAPAEPAEPAPAEPAKPKRPTLKDRVDCENAGTYFTILSEVFSQVQGENGAAGGASAELLVGTAVAATSGEGAKVPRVAAAAAA